MGDGIDAAAAVTPHGLDFAETRSDHQGMRTHLAVLALTVLAGCSATGNSMFGTSSAGAGAGTGTGAAGTGGTTTGTADTTGTGAGGDGIGGGFNLGDGGITGSGGGIGGAAVTLVYGQTATTLYKLDPTTDQITVVHDFEGCDGDVIDIALDKESNMYGTTFGGVYGIDGRPRSAPLSSPSNNSYPNSLSFVPAGTLEPDRGDARRLRHEQRLHQHRHDHGRDHHEIGPLVDGYASSGNIVSVIGGGTYLTVTGESRKEHAATASSRSIPRRAQSSTTSASSATSSVFGLAFWGGSCYGFDAEGEVFQIDLTNASTTMPIPTPDAPPGAQSGTAPGRPPRRR